MKDFLSFAVIAAVVTAASNWSSTWWFTRRQRVSLAEYHALRAAIELERFSFACANAIAELLTWRSSQGSGGSPFQSLPDLTYGASDEWKDLDVSLVNRLLTLQSDVARGNGIIIDDIQQTLPDDYSNESIEQAGLLGYHAHRLAQDLRLRYSSATAQLSLHPWDYVATLKEQHDKKIIEYSERRSLAQPG